MAGMINTLMALPSRTLSTKGLITYPDAATQALTGVEIIDWTVTENAGDHLPLGGASASTVRLRLDNRAGEWKSGGSILGAHVLDGAVIGIEIGAQHPEYSGSYDTIDGGFPTATYANTADGGSPGSSFSDVIDGGIPFNFPHVEWYWTRIGEYVVEKPKLTEMVVELSGSDYLANRAAKAFSDGLTYPRTVSQILQSACSQAGITLKSASFPNASVSIPVKPLWDENTKCRDVISYVACVAGGFARIDRAGMLEIVPFDDTNDYSIGTDRYIDLERKTTFGSLNALTVFPHGTKENAVRVATDIGLEDTDQNSIAVQGNPLLRYESAALTPLITGMFSVLGGLAFESAKVIWQGDPTLAVGDVLTVTDKGSATCPILVLAQIFSFSSGFGMTSENNIRTATSGTARNMRIFTPSGRLNATALEGDINIKAGENVNVLAGGNIKMAATNQLIFTGGSTLGDLLGNSGIKSHAGPSAPPAPSTGDLWFDTNNFNVCKRWSGSAWVEYTQGKLGNSKLTIDGNGVAILSGGSFTVASNNFMIDTSGNVRMKGAVTSTSGTIGGFTIATNTLYAQSSGKPLLKFDAANSEITLGDLKIYYDGTFAYQFSSPGNIISFTLDELSVGGGGYEFFNVDDGQVWCNGNVSADSFTDRTPSYTGKSAVTELKLVKNDKDGNIDHSTLPAFARKKITSKDKKGRVSETDGRDIGAMISILTKAVQELDERIDCFENRTK